VAGTRGKVSQTFDPGRLPKAELHVHIEGTLEPELLLTLAGRNKVELPYADAKDVEDAYASADATSFFDRYFTNLRVLREEQDFHDLTLAYLNKAKAQNVRHVEVSFEPQTHIERGVPFEIAIEGILSALRVGRTALDISSNLIVCFLRDRNASAATQTLQRALKYRDRIVAIDLRSTKPESLAAYQVLFERARAEHFLTLAHAGEFGTASHVWEALDLLKVARLDHGIGAMQDRSLVGRLRRQRVPLTVCPISDVRFGIVAELRAHPLKQMLDAGLTVTLSSDYPAYTGQYLSDVYRSSAQAQDLTEDELVTLARNSFDVAFIDDATRRRYSEELDAVVAGNQ
jgi:adenosine deaminase